MKRDFDLIRTIMLEVEAETSVHGRPFYDKNPNMFDALGIEPDYFEYCSNMTKEVEYHLTLMVQADLVTLKGSQPTYVQLTYSGHDFLEAVRQDTLWERTKVAVAETGGSATLEVIKALALGFLKKKVSEQTGIEI